MNLAARFFAASDNLLGQNRATVIRSVQLCHRIGLIRCGVVVNQRTRPARFTRRRFGCSQYCFSFPYLASDALWRSCRPVPAGPYGGPENGSRKNRRSEIASSADAANESSAMLLRRRSDDSSCVGSGWRQSEITSTLTF